MIDGSEVEPGLKSGFFQLANRTASYLADALDWINIQAMRLSMFSLLATAIVLTYSVASRYFFKGSNDWQDEVSVFMLAGSAFMCAGWVQSFRGHVSVDVLRALLSPRANIIRLAFVDLVSGLFCSFFAWKSWTLLLEALSEGQATSSSYGAPLWIPYSTMALGSTLLALKLILQFAVAVTGGRK